jgi:hypothetical protein
MAERSIFVRPLTVLICEHIRRFVALRETLPCALDVGAHGRLGGGRDSPGLKRRRSEMTLICPMWRPVLVREYVRFRNDKWQRVRCHCRSTRNSRFAPKVATI